MVDRTSNTLRIACEDVCGLVLRVSVLREEGIQLLDCIPDDVAGDYDVPPAQLARVKQWLDGFAQFYNGNYVVQTLNPAHFQSLDREEYGVMV